MAAAVVLVTACSSVATSTQTTQSSPTTPTLPSAPASPNAAATSGQAGTPGSPTSESSQAPRETALPPATPGPTPTQGAYADTIRIGIVSPFDRIGGRIGTSPFPLSNVINHQADMESEPVGEFLFRALYQYDSVLTPIPDLAAQPCETTADLLTVTCQLRASTFSNGSPLTADDVVFTYGMAASDACPFGVFAPCLGDTLESATATDPQTVRFVLRHPDPHFVTVTLPTLWIDSRALVDSQFEAFRSAASTVGSDPLRAEAERVDKALGGTDPDCEGMRAHAEPLIASAGIELPAATLWNIGPGRTFDACGWTGLLRDTLFVAADSLDATGLDAEAIAYQILPLNWHPTGSGSWMIDEGATRPGERVVLSPSPTTDHPPATPHIEFVSYPTRRDAAEGLHSGEIDWLHIPADFGGGVEQGGADLVHVVEGYGNVRFAEYADPTGLLELDFNVRAGKLFSDPNLRHALALCLDKRQLVDAASDGQGSAAAGVIPSDSWAGNPELTVPERDVIQARSMIESSGWRMVDGVYRKGSKRLSAEVWLGSARAERIKLANLLAFQAHDCGMDIRVRTTEDIVGAVYNWPHIPPGEKESFDMVISFSFGDRDPDSYMAYLQSDNVSSKKNPFGDSGGYASPEFDAAVEQARGTYDIAKRARFYREAQAVLAQDEPILPLWYRLDRDALDPGIASRAGTLDLDKPGWDWQRDQLVLAIDGQ